MNMCTHTHGHYNIVQGTSQDFYGHHFNNMFLNILINVTLLLASFHQESERNQRNNLYSQDIVILSIPIAIVYLYWQVMNILVTQTNAQTNKHKQTHKQTNVFAHLHKQICLLKYVSFMFHQ